jgi:hypothetical protein
LDRGSISAGQYRGQATFRQLAAAAGGGSRMARLQRRQQQAEQLAGIAAWMVIRPLSGDPRIVSLNPL